MASNKTIASAVRNANKLSAAATKKEARLTATLNRTGVRISKAEDRALRAAERLSAAREALEKAKAKLEAVRKAAAELVAKQQAEAKDASERAAEAKVKANRMTPTVKAGPVGGTVETETGTVRPISKAAATVITKLVGRKTKGTFQPLDGVEAQSILSALDKAGNVGDIFTVQVKGRKTALMFSVEAEGLRFETVSTLATV